MKGAYSPLLTRILPDNEINGSDNGSSYSGGIEHPLFKELALNECTICLETKLVKEFPERRTTSTCSHLPSACRECIQSSILAQFDEKAMEHITCLECSELLAPSDVQAFVPKARYRQYAEHAMNKTLSSNAQFVWCPLNDCESGQIHPPGTKQPVVLCESCDRLFCFTHHTEWHRDHTCDEWEQYLADRTFRSQIAEAEVKLRQSIMSAEEAAKDRYAVAQARRQEEERAKAERRRIKEQRRLAREEELRKLARQQEKEQGELTVKRSSRSCPKCKQPSQKISGCDHVKCLVCGTHWDYGTGRAMRP
ncbi:hypothetical protein PG995_013946 [Apiospora arundinis]